MLYPVALLTLSHEIVMVFSVWVISTNPVGVAGIFSIGIVVSSSFVKFPQLININPAAIATVNVNNV